MAVRRSVELGGLEECDVEIAGQFPEDVVGSQVPGDDQGGEEEEEEGADVLQSLFPRFDPSVSMFRTKREKSQRKEGKVFCEKKLKSMARGC